MRKRIKSFLLITSIVLALLVVSISVLFQRIRAEFGAQKILSELHEKNTFPTTQSISHDGYKINCSYTGKLSSPKVLLIHGSPGYWYDFKNIFADTTLNNKFCLISYDRPGYGRTTIPAMGQLKGQAKVAAAVMDHFGKTGEKFTVLGHSYGGAVLEQILLDHQEMVRNAIYVAPCLSPKYQKAKWYNLMISGGLTNRIMPHELRTSNMEMMALEDCLTQNEKRLPGISIPTSYIQGKRDVLVPHQTLDYYLSHHKNVDYQLLKDVNHFVPWSTPELIIQAIEAGYLKYSP